MFNKAWFFSAHNTPIRILFDTNKNALTTIYLLVSVAQKTTKYYFNNFWQVQLLSGWVVEANELCANVMNCLSLTFVWCPNGYCIWHIHLFLMFDRIRIEFSVHVQSIIFVYARKYVQRKENAWIVKVFSLYLLHAYFAFMLQICYWWKKREKSSLVTQSPINPKYFSNKREPFMAADNIFSKRKKEKSAFKSSLQTSWRSSNFGCPFDKLNTRTCIDSICDKH